MPDRSAKADGRKLVEPIPIPIQIKHKAGTFVAASAYRVGGKTRVRSARAGTISDALEGVLRQFRRAGHAGKRFEVTGVELDIRSRIGLITRRAVADHGPQLEFTPQEEIYA